MYNAVVINVKCAYDKNMIEESQTVKTSTLKALVEAGSITSVCVTGRQGGFAIVVEYGGAKHVLATTRGGIRVFTLSAAGAFLRTIGFSRFQVDITDYRHGRIRKARPDRAAVMRKTRTKLRQQSLI